jgi:hypothetical protein
MYGFVGRHPAREIEVGSEVDDVLQWVPIQFAREAGRDLLTSIFTASSGAKSVTGRRLTGGLSSAKPRT